MQSVIVPLAICPTSQCAACTSRSPQSPAAVHARITTSIHRRIKLSSSFRRRIRLRILAQLGSLEDDEASRSDGDEDGQHEPSPAATNLATIDDVIYWADYMDANVEGVDPRLRHGTEEEASPKSSSSDLAQVEDVVPPASKAIEEGRSPRHDLDPINDTTSMARFFGGDSLPLRPNPGPMDEWDLRAAMEKRKRMDAERAAWMEDKALTVSQHIAVASDWRTDVRIKDTGDPTQPDYREWTLSEIWDLITQGGKAVDPRDVPHSIIEPNARTDFVAEGFVQQLDIPEWLAAQGKIIDEDDVDQIVDFEGDIVGWSKSEMFELDGFNNVSETNVEGQVSDPSPESS